MSQEHHWLGLVDEKLILSQYCPALYGTAMVGGLPNSVEILVIMSFFVMNIILSNYCFPTSSYTWYTWSLPLILGRKISHGADQRRNILKSEARFPMTYFAREYTLSLFCVLGNFECWLAR